MGDSVKNVIFDMGGVLMTFDGPHFSSIFTDTPEDAALLQDALFGSTMWSLLDSGTISHETMARYAENHLPERLSTCSPTPRRASWNSSDTRPRCPTLTAMSSPQTSAS